VFCSEKKLGDMFKGTDLRAIGDCESQIVVDLVNNKDQSESLDIFFCPKCDMKFQKRWEMRIHALTHYNHLFYAVLPDKEPFRCPVCQKTCSQRQALMRHYALGHSKGFQLTDLTPEDLKLTRKKCETSALNL